MNPSSPTLRGLLRRLGCRRGSVVVETALIMPLVALAVVCSVDVARYMQLSARADRIASGVADLVSRADGIRDRMAIDHQTRSTDIGVYIEMAREMALPESLGTGGGVVISSVTGGAVAPTVNWMRAWGSNAAASSIRLEEIGPLPVGIPFVVAEILLPFEPVILDRTTLLGSIGFDRVIYRRALYRPRTAALTTLQPPNS